MNNVMQNEGEYVMQISALTSSLNVSKNISADLLSHFTVRSLHNSSLRSFISTVFYILTSSPIYYDVLLMSEIIKIVLSISSICHFLKVLGFRVSFIL